MQVLFAVCGARVASQYFYLNIFFFCFQEGAGQLGVFTVPGHIQKKYIFSQVAPYGAGFNFGQVKINGKIPGRNVGFPAGPAG